MTIRKKTFTTIALAVMLALALSGCMFTGNQPAEPEINPEATVMPNPNATNPLPQGTIAPQQNGAAAPGNEAVKEKFDWRVKAAMVEGRINLFSEIAESRIVVYETTALVGVKFTSQYKGELIQRIRDMIAGEVMAADDTIQVVAVTADANDVNTIFDLSEQLKTGVEAETLRDDVEKITRNATTLR